MAFANHISEFQNQGINFALLTKQKEFIFFHAVEIDIKHVKVIGESVKMALEWLSSLILTY